MPVIERLPARHVEQNYKKEHLLARIWNSLVHPIIRLPVQFPWGLKDFSKMYAVATLFYVAGSLIPLFIMFGAVILAAQFFPELFLSRLTDAEGHPNMHVIVAATLVSFCSGFGAELLYFRQQLKKQGIPLGRLLALNLQSLDGKWLDALKRSAYALIVALVAQGMMEHLPFVPRPHQVTADMAAGAHGTTLVAFGILAAILAPFFEEVIFRGIVFNAFRRILREGRIFTLLRGSTRLSDYAAVALSALVFALAHMDASAFIQLFVLGVFLAELYRRSGTLACPMLLHAMNNMVATLLIVSR